MNKQEAFEHERRSWEKFDNLYRRYGWAQSPRVTGRKNKDYDLTIKINGGWKKVEEKYLSEKNMELNEQTMIVEDMQDTETCDPGWLKYTKADYIAYGFPIRNGDRFYLVNVPMLRLIIEIEGNNFRKIVSTEGWGNTTNWSIPWYILTTNNIATIL